MNTWPKGCRHPMSQYDHEVWNQRNYPGTRQMCSICDEPTGYCEKDEILTVDGDPVCWDCSQTHPEMMEMK